MLNKEESWKGEIRTLKLRRTQKSFFTFKRVDSIGWKPVGSSALMTQMGGLADIIIISKYFPF